jgi:hypothetical protein
MRPPSVTGLARNKATGDNIEGGSKCVMNNCNFTTAFTVDQSPEEILTPSIMFVVGGGERLMAVLTNPGQIQVPLQRSPQHLEDHRI